MKLLRLLPILFLALAACKNMPEPYAPPEQRSPLEISRPYRISRVISMDDGDAESHFVRDIRGLSGNWRWTGKRPALRVQIQNPAKLHLVADLAIADATFKVTGPVKIAFYLNDTAIAVTSFDMPGPRHIDMPLPPQPFPANSEAVLSAEIDKVWTSPADGTQLGFILTQIGLREE